MRARKKLRKAALSLLFLIVIYVFIFCLTDTHNFQMLYAILYRTKSEKSDTHIKNVMRMKKKTRRETYKVLAQKGVEILVVHLSLVQEMHIVQAIYILNFQDIFVITIQLVVYQYHLN